MRSNDAAQKPRNTSKTANTKPSCPYNSLINLIASSLHIGRNKLAYERSTKSQGEVASLRGKAANLRGKVVVLEDDRLTNSPLGCSTKLKTKQIINNI